MNYQILIAGLILLMLITIPGSAFDVREGDSIVISTPVPDDLLISGGTVTINAPVKSVTFAGERLIVNAPVEENLIAAGGEIQINAPVGTDVIAAGGKVEVNSEVGGKVMAVGGKLTMNGKTSNIAIYGDSVTLGNSSHITGDALIGASGYTPGGIVDGKIQADVDKGGFGPSINFDKIIKAISFLFMILHVICAIGMLILGVILIRLLPGPCTSVINTVREKTLMSLVFGIAEIVIAFIIMAILLITLVGIPLAIIIGLTTLIGLMIATIFTGAALGTLIAGKMEKNISLILSFVIGFIILEILFLIPVFGIFFEMIAVFIGLGALVMTTGEAVGTLP